LGNHCQGEDATLSAVSNPDSGLLEKKPDPTHQFSHLFNTVKEEEVISKIDKKRKAVSLLL